jgi:outer membrane protein, heavy metal efflux system
MKNESTTITTNNNTKSNYFAFVGIIVTIKLKNMKRLFLIIALILLVTVNNNLYSQQDTLRLSLTEIERMFLENNAVLLAQRLNIDAQKAYTTQARVWDNPQLSIREFNFYVPDADKLEDGLPANARQFSIELEQLITTAGKRSKNVELHKVNSEIAENVYYDILRSLKYELRTSYFELALNQEIIKVLEEELSSVEILLESMQIQLDEQFISLRDFIRVQALRQNLFKEILEHKREVQQLITKLTIFISTENNAYILANIQDLDLDRNIRQDLDNLIALAFKERSDLAISRNEIALSKMNLSLQRAMAYPDISLSAGYDRYGGIFKDYIGLGMSIDLPLFNRNQGNIKAARFELEQAELLNKHTELQVRSEIIASYNTLLEVSETRNLFSTDYLTNYENMMQAVRENYLNRNLNLIDYLDFFESYKETKFGFFNVQTELLKSKEELIFSIGTEINIYVE